MPAEHGAHWASRRSGAHSARPRGFQIPRLLVATIALALVGFGAHDAARPAPVLAGQPGAGMKVVIIVGPAGGSTGDYLSQADVLADQAEATGMNVTRIYTPRATWDIVKEKSQGANLLVFFGHGNGFPSLHGGDMREDSQNGFGLNACYETCSTTSQTKYYGANYVRKHIKLAKHSIVLLYRLCYASGNAEWDTELPGREVDRKVAFQRVDNFAAGFLAVGAGAVIAWGWPQKINLPRDLAKTDLSVDKIFMTKAANTDNPQAFMGRLDYYAASRRTEGATVHLDPHSSYGYLRAITGDLGMTAKEWRGEAPPPDATAPELSGVSATVGSASAEVSAEIPFFSPNADGTDDILNIKRSLSEAATLTTVVESATGPVVTLSESADGGPGRTTWNGTDAEGARVPDGTYTLKLTARDRAGNVGPTQSLQVRVLTALGGVSASTPAIEVADRDSLASSVRFQAELSAPALVSWRVVDRAGRVVRQGPTDVAVDPATDSSTLLYLWDGLDEAGQPVSDGTYRGIASASTDAGTASYASEVVVGPYMVSAVPKSVSRGQKIKLAVRNTEPLAGAPTLTVWQSGLKAYTITMNKVSDTRWTIAVTLKAGGKAGIVKFSVAGTDVDGGSEKLSFSRTLR